jgi:hypothetical protein
MANLALKTANRVEIIASLNQHTLRAAVAITAGQAIRIGTAGKWILAKATSAAAGAGVYIATRTVGAGESVTGIRKGQFDGFDVSGLAYGAAVYLSDTDGALADAAGTASIVVGRVGAIDGVAVGSSPNKILEVDCPL